MVVHDAGDRRRRARSEDSSAANTQGERQQPVQTQPKEVPEQPEQSLETIKSALDLWTEVLRAAKAAEGADALALVQEAEKRVRKLQHQRTDAKPLQERRKVLDRTIKNKEGALEKAATRWREAYAQHQEIMEELTSL